MSRLFNDLAVLLQQLIVEHRNLLKHVTAQQEAMKKADLNSMDLAMRQQEASRLRIVALENRRRMVVQNLARTLKIDGDLTIPRLAQLDSAGPTGLLTLRNELKSLIGQIQTRSHVAGRLAGAVLGHLNTVVRLLAGAVEQAGVYTKHGVPQVSARIGVMDAVA